jgi:catechol 2,3-dioxygenase-like lactoylglutathione lyase family enzyme
MTVSTHVAGVLETCLYAVDLPPAAAFYADVLGLEEFARAEGRHVFFRSGDGVFLLFNPERTSEPGHEVPPHGAHGPGHVAFAVAPAEMSAWRDRLRRLDVQVEAEVRWPEGGMSLYMRDPAGNSVELATRGIWSIPEPAAQPGRSAGRADG